MSIVVKELPIIEQDSNMQAASYVFDEKSNSKFTIAYMHIFVSVISFISLEAESISDSRQSCCLNSLGVRT